MNPQQFIEWLDEYLTGRTELTPAQTQIVNKKLNDVFIKVTPVLQNPNVLEEPICSDGIGSFNGFLKCSIIKDGIEVPVSC